LGGKEDIVQQSQEREGGYILHSRELGTAKTPPPPQKPPNEIRARADRGNRFASLLRVILSVVTDSERDGPFEKGRRGRRNLTGGGGI